MIRLRLRILLSTLLVLPSALPSQSLQSTAQTTVTQLQSFLDAYNGAADFPVKCGLGPAMLYHRFRGALAPRLADELSSLFQRPTHLTESYVSEGGHFKVHYTLQGIDAVDPTDANNDGLPDFVVEAARAAEHSYRLLVDSLGFRPPIPDNGIDGPEYDIYIMDLRRVYGWTYTENPPATDNPLTYATYMQVDNDFVGDYYTHGLDALRVTVAHEFFHALHFAYVYRDSDLFFYEMSATWFEDVAYDDINDYLQYLPKFFSQLHLPLHLSDQWHEYGASVWLKYWLQDRDFRSLRRIWETMQQRPALEAIKLEVEREGKLFPEAMAEFFSWCLYTGPRHIPGEYFEEGDLYPMLTVPVNGRISVLSDTVLVDSSRALTARFYEVSTDPTKDFSAFVIAEPASSFRLVAAAEKLSGELGKAVSRQGPVPVAMRAIENEGKIFVAAVNARLPDNVQRHPLTLPFDRYDLNISLKDLGPISGILQPPRPNPFIVDGESTLSIVYNLDGTADITITIVNERGQEVFQRKIGPKPMGLNQFIWDGRSNSGEAVPSGVYIIVLHTGEGRDDFQKVAVLRR